MFFFFRFVFFVRPIPLPAPERPDNSFTAGFMFARSGAATNVLNHRHDGDSVDHKDVETYDAILEMLLVRHVAEHVEMMLAVCQLDKLDKPLVAPQSAGYYRVRITELSPFDKVAPRCPACRRATPTPCCTLVRTLQLLRSRR